MAILFRHNFITCLSGDTKPTADPAAGYGLSTGYRLFETDTNKTYFFSGGAWVELAGGGDSVTINTTALVNVDLNDATPAAPLTSVGQATNVKWQHDAGSPANVSAYMYGVPLMVKSTVDVKSVTSVLSTVPGLDFTLAANRFYAFEYRVLTWSDLATVGVCLSLQTTISNTTSNPFAVHAEISVAVPGTAGEFSGPIVASNSTLFKPLAHAGTTLQEILAIIKGNMFTSVITGLKVMFATETGTTTVGVMKGSMGFLYDYGTT